jgi:hypothetical protein
MRAVLRFSLSHRLMKMSKGVLPPCRTFCVSFSPSFLRVSPPSFSFVLSLNPSFYRFQQRTETVGGIRMNSGPEFSISPWVSTWRLGGRFEIDPGFICLSLFSIKTTWNATQIWCPRNNMASARVSSSCRR